jgi:hypothetical protein
MDTAAFVISALAVILAVLLAGGGLWFQWQLFRAADHQAEATYSALQEFREHTKELLGELRGVTERMAAIQDRQFSQMLDAFITRSALASEAAARVDDSRRGIQQMSVDLDQLRQALRQQGSSGEIASRLDSVEHRLQDIQSSISATARLTSHAVRPNLGRFMGIGVGTHWFEEGVLFSPWVNAAREVANAGRPLAQAEISDLLRADLPGAVGSGLLSVESRTNADGVTTAFYHLTDFGEQVLRSIAAGAVDQNPTGPEPDPASGATHEPPLS